VRPVSNVPGRHTFHAYFNTTPESPDGRFVLFYSSTVPDGQTGEVRIVERSTGKETLLARDVTTEDAHRTGCQQWSAQGKQVVYHDVRQGQWVVAAVDVATLKERVLARDRQLAFGRPEGNVVPIYRPHWNPGAHGDFELLNVETDEIRTVVTADRVRQTYGDLVQSIFGERPISLFFPILSPDGKRAFFKLATPAGGDFRSKDASLRQGLVACDLATGDLLFAQPKWEHPAWHPDSRTIVEAGNRLIDSTTGLKRQIPDLPRYPGSHPSISPDGKLLVTDTILDPPGGPRREWGVAVADLRGAESVVIHKADNSRGASSWRPSHPHPIFSPDSRRIYFNVNQTEWTQLYVAEAASASK
jgi:Tol biopolymer transport system component